MTNEEWNNIQEQAYLQLFSNDEGLSSKDLLKKLENIRGIWRKLYSIIGKEVDPNNDRFSVMDISKVCCNDKVYLMLRIGLWEFIVIDINNMRCLSKEEVIATLNHELFDRFYGLDESDVEYFTFEKLKKKPLKQVVDHFVEHEQVLSSDKRLVYKFYQKDGIVGCYTISCDKSDSMVSVNDYKNGRCNYIFLDIDLKVYGASNLTGNKESVAKLFDGSRDILIPVYLLGSIGDEVINQAMEDKSICIKKEG